MNAPEVQLTPGEKERIAALVLESKRALVERIPGRFVLDLAFVGNSSGLYEWDPGRLVDLDVCLFVEKKDRSTGQWIADVRDELRRRIGPAADFDCRLIVGPYKPPLTTIDRPYLFVHLAVFLESEYLDTPALMRWSWRKYRCLVDRDRLRRLAPLRISTAEVAARAVKLLDRIESGHTTMREWLLPEFEEGTVRITAGDPNFAEVCFSSVATCTRHHARALGHDEADVLANREFFRWYVDHINRSSAVAKLAALKERSRNEAFGAVLAPARVLAAASLRDLIARLA